MPSKHAQTMEQMRTCLNAAFTPDTLSIDDDSAAHAGHAGAASGGGHFRLHMVSRAFSGQSRLQRQRLVYDRLADLMKRDIHALSMILQAPDEVTRTADER